MKNPEKIQKLSVSHQAYIPCLEGATWKHIMYFKIYLFRALAIHQWTNQQLITQGCQLQFHISSWHSVSIWILFLDNKVYSSQLKRKGTVFKENWVTHRTSRGVGEPDLDSKERHWAKGPLHWEPNPWNCCSIKPRVSVVYWSEPMVPN